MNENRGLERRLRQERPEARGEFVRALAQRIGGRRTGVPRLRLGVALGLAVGLVGVSAAAGAFSYTTHALTSSKNTFGKVFLNQRPSHVSGTAGALANASAALTTYNGLTATCTQTGSKLNVHIAGTSADATAADTITFTFAPSGATTTIPGSASFDFHFNDSSKAGATSFTATQTNNLATASGTC